MSKKVMRLVDPSSGKMECRSVDPSLGESTIRRPLLPLVVAMFAGVQPPTPDERPGCGASELIDCRRPLETPLRRDFFLNVAASRHFADPRRP
jgi:hypothetical protein